MSNVYSVLHRHRHLLSRVFYGDPTIGSITIIAPAKATFIRASAVGAGSASGSQAGGGAAFARVKTTTSAGEQFTLSLGNYLITPDTTLVRVTGSVTILKAAGANAQTGGQASNSIGDTKRSGVNANSTGYGGASAGDDADPLPLGFGSRGISGEFLGPGPGGGGWPSHLVYKSADATYTVAFSHPGGDGRACIEFFDKDPASWGYGG